MKLLVPSDCRAASSTGATVTQRSGLLIGVSKLGDNLKRHTQTLTNARARCERPHKLLDVVHRPDLLLAGA
jgi:hypothetical protein